MAPKLNDLPEYRSYLEDVPSRRIELPPYELVTFETKDGVQQEGVYICPGEVFCRVPRCLARCDSTTNLRKHVGKHQGYVVAPGKDGAMSVAARDIAQSFFISLYSREATASASEKTPVKTPTKRKAEAEATEDATDTSSSMREAAISASKRTPVQAPTKRKAEANATKDAPSSTREAAISASKKTPVQTSNERMAEVTEEANATKNATDTASNMREAAISASKETPIQTPNKHKAEVNVTEDVTDSPSSIREAAINASKQTPVKAFNKYIAETKAADETLNSTEDATGTPSNMREAATDASEKAPVRTSTKRKAENNVEAEFTKDVTGTPDSHARPELFRNSKGDLDIKAIRRYGSDKSGSRAPCKSCRTAKRYCATTEVCDFWQYFNLGNEDSGNGSDSLEAGNIEQSPPEDKGKKYIRTMSPRRVPILYI